MCIRDRTNTCKSDTANINWNKYGTLGHTPKPVCDIFCDNVVMGCIVCEEQVIKDEEGNKLLTTGLLKKLRQDILSFFVSNGLTNIKDSDIKAKGIQVMDGAGFHLQPLSKNELTELYKNYRLEIKDGSKAILQRFKIELSDLPYNTIKKIFSNDNLFDLKQKHIRICDIDMTRDYSEVSIKVY